MLTFLIEACWQGVLQGVKDVTDVLRFLVLIVGRRKVGGVNEQHGFGRDYILTPAAVLLELGEKKATETKLTLAKTNLSHNSRVSHPRKYH